jgi:hypothetical protein
MLPGCISRGATRDEALAKIPDAITVCLKGRAGRGMPPTFETRQIEVTLSCLFSETAAGCRKKSVCSARKITSAAICVFCG